MIIEGAPWCPFKKLRCDMRRRLLKFLLTILIVVLILSALAYYLFITKFYDMAERFIFETAIPPELEILENIASETETQIPGKMPDDIQHESPQPQTKPIPSLPDDTKIKPEKSVPDKLNQEISFEDKRRIIQMVAKSLTSEDIKYLTNLLKGGLTPEKKKLAVELALKRFGPEEIKEIQNLYHKYKKYTF
jgi:hypothetical protein